MSETRIDPRVMAAVVEVLVATLGIEDRAATLDAATPLLGELPELDSLGVVELAVALEERFDIVVDDDDFTGDVFETVGSLAAFVAARAG
ncbi:phosphopantetheine-binding protein [Nocardioides pantholopis]|uniref:phosphopantetheine-binding protein n=1 Tax=Nocardioides pantholopis TaxID=2483798 RepID=UPI0019D06E68|nr:phosphopantetheine-binding protein [Nocardioides pantholopis]